MSRGGRREGAGRKRGSESAATKERRAAIMEMARELKDAGATPLDILSRVMQGDVSITEMQFEAAKAAAPYIHPKLSAIQMDARVRRSVEDMTDEELAALASGEESGGEGEG